MSPSDARLESDPFTRSSTSQSIHLYLESNRMYQGGNPSEAFRAHDIQTKFSCHGLSDSSRRALLQI
jgi:hypothetical protein